MSSSANPQLTEMLRQQLRDIHTPESISWWPLAPGWWLLVALSLAAFVYVYFYLRKKQRDRQYRQILKYELAGIYALWETNRSTSVYCQNANELLKRCLIKLYAASPHTLKESLAISATGDAWLLTLESVYKPFSASTRDVLSGGLYRPEHRLSTTLDVPSLNREIELWLQNHKTRIPELTVRDAPLSDSTTREAT